MNETLFYKKGNTIPHECGADTNLLKPAREFKEFSFKGGIQNKKDLAPRFIQCLAKFACECLNRRTNGKTT